MHQGTKIYTECHFTKLAFRLLDRKAKLKGHVDFDKSNIGFQLFPSKDELF